MRARVWTWVGLAVALTHCMFLTRHLGGSDFHDPGLRKAAGPLYTPTLSLTFSSPAELPDHCASVPSDFKWVQHRPCRYGCAEQEAHYVEGSLARGRLASALGRSRACEPPWGPLGTAAPRSGPRFLLRAHLPNPLLPLVHPVMLSEVLTRAIARAGGRGAGGRKDIPKQIIHMDGKEPRECLPGSRL